MDRASCVLFAIHTAAGCCCCCMQTAAVQPPVMRDSLMQQEHSEAAAAAARAALSLPSSMTSDGAMYDAVRQAGRQGFPISGVPAADGRWPAAARSVNCTRTMRPQPCSSVELGAWTGRHPPPPPRRGRFAFSPPASAAELVRTCGAAAAAAAALNETANAK